MKYEISNVALANKRSKGENACVRVSVDISNRRTGLCRGLYKDVFVFSTCLSVVNVGADLS